MADIQRAADTDWSPFDRAGLAVVRARKINEAFAFDVHFDQMAGDDLIGIVPLSPYFVVELQSPSDQLAPLQEKMREYSDNGVQLGWLIDPLEKRIHIYRSGQPVASKDNPATLGGDPVLPAFVLDLRPLW